MAFYSFRKEKIINYFWFWKDVSLAQLKYLAERDRKGFELNKKLNFRNDEYREGFKPYKDFRENDIVSRDEYRKTFLEIDSEYELKMSATKKEASEKFGILSNIDKKNVNRFTVLGASCNKRCPPI